MIKNDPSAEQDLLLSLKEGDKQAFDLIFKQYWLFVYEAACRRLQDPDAANDIAQELFMSLWDRRESLEIRNLAAWFHQSVRYRVINHFKAVLTESRYKKELSSLTKSYYLHDAMEKADIEAAFEIALKELPARMRLIFEMSRKQEKTIDEIADNLQLSHQTIKNQMTNALRIIRKKFNYAGLMKGLLLILTLHGLKD